MKRLEATIAATRFGLGAAPGELDRIAADPRGWLTAQVEADPKLPDAMQALPPLATMSTIGGMR